MNHIPVGLKRFFYVIALLGVCTTFFGCHTAHGFGQDVEKTGEKIQEKSQ